MTPQNQTPTLDDVLNEFMAAHDEGPQVAALEAFAKRYPEFRRELVEFAAAWAEQITLPPEAELSAEEEKVLVDRAMSHVANVVYDREVQAQTPETKRAPLKSLTAEAKDMGYRAEEFAKACGLDLLLISKLNGRQILPNTVPSRLVRHMARLLSRPAETIVRYLAAPPESAPARAFLAREKPRSPKQQSFADAVLTSSLSDAEKARWLDDAAGLEEV